MFKKIKDFIQDFSWKDIVLIIIAILLTIFMTIGIIDIEIIARIFGLLEKIKNSDEILVE